MTRHLIKTPVSITGTNNGPNDGGVFSSYPPRASHVSRFDDHRTGAKRLPSIFARDYAVIDAMELRVVNQTKDSGQSTTVATNTSAPAASVLGAACQEFRIPMDPRLGKSPSIPLNDRCILQDLTSRQHVLRLKQQEPLEVVYDEN